MSWASIAETLTYTQITVTQADIESAQFMVELFADTTEDVTVSSKNTRLLKMAVAYQAAWISDHPDIFTHVDVSTMLQDGIQFTQGHANAGLLAPMAKRAIDRLSWKRNRNIKIRPKKKVRNRQIWQFGGNGSSSADYEYGTDSQWESE